LIYLLQATKLY